MSSMVTRALAGITARLSRTTLDSHGESMAKLTEGIESLWITQSVNVVGVTPQTSAAAPAGVRSNEEEKEKAARRTKEALGSLSLAEFAAAMRDRYERSAIARAKEQSRAGTMAAPPRRDRSRAAIEANAPAREAAREARATRAAARAAKVAAAIATITTTTARAAPNGTTKPAATKAAPASNRVGKRSAKPSSRKPKTGSKLEKVVPAPFVETPKNLAALSKEDREWFEARDKLFAEQRALAKNPNRFALAAAKVPAPPVVLKLPEPILAPRVAAPAKNTIVRVAARSGSGAGAIAKNAVARNGNRRGGVTGAAVANTNGVTRVAKRGPKPAGKVSKPVGTDFSMKSRDSAAAAAPRARRHGVALREQAGRLRMHPDRLAQLFDAACATPDSASFVSLASLPPLSRSGSSSPGSPRSSAAATPARRFSAPPVVLVNHDAMVTPLASCDPEGFATAEERFRALHDSMMLLDDDVVHEFHVENNQQMCNNPGQFATGSSRHDEDYSMMDLSECRADVAESVSGGWDWDMTEITGGVW